MQAGHCMDNLCYIEGVPAVRLAASRLVDDLLDMDDHKEQICPSGMVRQLLILCSVSSARILMEKERRVAVDGTTHWSASGILRTIPRPHT